MSGPAAMALEDVVAYVSSSSDPQAHTGLVAKLKKHGARHALRLSKDVTHIVFQRKSKPTPDERGAEDAELRALHERAGKVRACVRGRRRRAWRRAPLPDGPDHNAAPRRRPAPASPADHRAVPPRIP
jgi:hypothetical protein